MCARSYVKNWCSILGRFVRMLSRVRGKKALGSPGRVWPPGFLAGRWSSGDIVLRGQLLLVDAAAQAAVAVAPVLIAGCERQW